jgi:hypothetical protein
MKRVIGAVVWFTVLASPTLGQAAQRYASPAGFGTECSQAQPCSLQEAVTKAKSNDEVIVNPGPYPVAAPLEVPPTSSNVYIHGDPGGAVPTIDAKVAGAPIGFSSEGDRLGYLDITNSSGFANAAICPTGGRVERIRATVSGEAALGVNQASNCTVSDSVIRADGSFAVALFAEPSMSGNTGGVVRNVTAIATGSESIGVLATADEFFSPGSYTLDMRNVIADGGQFDLEANQSLDGPGKIVVSNSNFDTVKQQGTGMVIDAGGNQTPAPIFVNAAGGNYREAAGSPTIDAGSTDRIGALDLGGNPRSLGAAPDIGAYEFVPPAAAPGGVRSLSIRPRRFRPTSRSGGPFAPAILRSRPPKGAAVTYTLTGPATVTFSASRRMHGRLAGKRCVRKTRANAGHRRCTFYVPVKGSFTQAGAAGDNRFIFSGRIDGRALRPGAYKLTAFAGHLVSAPFEIGGLRRRGRG